MLQAYRKLCGGWILVTGLVSLATTACSSGASDTGTTNGTDSGASGSASGTSGTSGTSGSAASGSSSGTPIGDAGVDATVDAGPPPVNCPWTFNDPDAGLQGWTFNPYQTPFDPNPNDADGVDPGNLSAQALITWDDEGGTDPMPPLGEMTVTVPFSAYTPPFGQKADIYLMALPPVAMDLSQQVITMQVKLDPAPDGGIPFSPSPNAPGGLIMYIKTGTKYVYAQNTYTNINSADHNWVQYSFDVKNGVDIASSPSYLDGGFNARQVVQIGFTLNTGSGGLALPDGAPPMTPPPTPATFHIDSICLIPSQ